MYKGLVRLIGLVAVSFLTATPVARAADKPNVLLILSDDLCADLGCYGAPVKTPNIDKLAEQGVRLDRAYCQFPLCGPSRCSFMSGLRPETTGVIVNGQPVRHKLKDVVTLPQLFRQHGYYSMRVGKIYHLGIPNQVGTPGPDDPASWDYTFNPKGNEYPTLDDGDQFDPNPKNGQSFRRNLLKDDGHTQADYQSADEAIRLLNENKGRPFFLAVGFIRPHVPEVAPKKYFDLYDISQIHLPEMPAEDWKDIPKIAAYHKEANFGMTDADGVESIRAYHATISFMDAQVGRVVDELDRLKLRDKTIVVFMSDHGYLLGQHRLWQKMLLFEGSCRVPMIVSAPQMKTAGQTARGLVESIDLFPTLAELAQLPAPKELEGTSFAGLLEDPKREGKPAAFTIVTRNVNKVTKMGRSIRTDRWRYTEWDSGRAGTELYDEQNDPNEFTNLAGDPQHADVVANLRSQLTAMFPATQPAR